MGVFVATKKDRIELSVHAGLPVVITATVSKDGMAYEKNRTLDLIRKLFGFLPGLAPSK